MAEVQTDFYPKANPNAFFDTANNAVGFANSVASNQLLGTQNQQAQQDLRFQQLGILRGALGAIAANPNASYDDFASLGSLVQQGLVSPDFYQSEMAKLPQGGNPQMYQQIANKYNAQLATVGERYAMQTGIPLGTANQPVSYTGPMGQTVNSTGALYATDIGAAGRPMDIGIGGGAPTSGNALMSSPAPLGSNALAPNPYGMEGQQQPFGVNPDTGVNYGRVVGPTPGEVEAKKVAGTQSGEWLANARQREANFATDMISYDKALNALQALGQTGSGVGTDQINMIKSLAVSLGLPGADAEGVKAYDEAKKYLVGLATANGDTGTNDKLAATFAANASTDISNAAAIDVVKTAATNRRFQNATLLAYEASGLPADQASQFATQFASSQDPRAYGVDYLTPDAKAKLRAELDKAGNENQKLKFAQSLSTAIALGLVQPPQQ